MGVHVTCSKCNREHYASFEQCPYCAVAEPQKLDDHGEPIPPQYDNDEARAAYARIGSARTWDGRQETAENPLGGDGSEESLPVSGAQ
jgi:hypothetical protein